MIPGGMTLPWGGAAHGLLVAVAASNNASNAVATSLNATTWVAHDAIAARTWKDVQWVESLGLYVAVAGIGSNNQNVMTSPDGETWTLRASGSNADYSALAWSNALSMLAAIGRSQEVDGNTGLMTSANGINWSEQAAGNFPWGGICAITNAGFIADYRFCAVGGGAITTLWTADGVTWVGGNQLGAASWADVIYIASQDRLVAIASGGSVSYNDGSGGGWVAGSGTAAQAYRRLAFSPTLNRLVACSETTPGNAFAYSDDFGATWSDAGSPDTGAKWADIEWVAELGKFVTVSSQASVATRSVATSATGLSGSWELGTNPAACDQPWSGLCWRAP